MSLYQKISITGFLLILCAYSVFGADFGLALSVTPEYDSKPDKPLTLTGSLSPWVSALLSPNLSLYASAALTKEYKQGQDPIFQDGFPFLIELDRTELNWRPFSTLFMQFGRQQFADSAGLIVSGLYDGVHGDWSLGNVRLSMGIFYTGLLYKKTADIVLTDGDSEKNSAETDYSDITTYFATRRVLIPITAEFLELSEQSSLALNGVFQFDVNGADITPGTRTLHSQHLELQYNRELLDTVHLTMAVSTGIAEAKIQNSFDTRFGFAVLAGIDWELPTELQDLLSLQVRWSNGNVSDSIGAYIPISGISVGEIFNSRLSGMMHIDASYIARLYRTLSAGGGAGYFIRTDLETFQDAELKPYSDSPPLSERLLGGELYGSLIWAPQSAIQLTAKGGVFLPGLGGAFISSAKSRLKVSLGTIVSF